MKNLADMIEDTKMKIYEIEALVKCICNSLEICSDSYILPLADITHKRLESFSNDFEEFENEIYKQLL